MARPDVRFNAPSLGTPRSSEPKPDLRFADHEPDVIDLRDGPALAEADARAILGVLPEAGWDEVRSAYAHRLDALTGERRQVNVAYATLRLLAAE